MTRPILYDVRIEPAYTAKNGRRYVKFIVEGDPHYLDKFEEVCRRQGMTFEQAMHGYIEDLLEKDRSSMSEKPKK